MPKEEADTLMLYEVYAGPDAFQAHWTGPSMQQVKQDAAGLQLSLTGVRCDVVECTLDRSNQFASGRAFRFYLRQRLAADLRSILSEGSWRRYEQWAED